MNVTILSVIFKVFYNFLYEIRDILGPKETTIMKCIKQVTSALLQKLGGIVDWPESQEARRKISTRFAKKGRPYGFPLVVGAIDGTLIGITPPRQSGSIYIGRHDQACLNVIAVSDAGS
jgi:hypothetical protein